MELYLLVMPCMNNGIILNSIVQYVDISRAGEIFFSSKVKHVFPRAQSGWLWLSLFISVLKKRAEAIAAYTVSASQSTGQAHFQKHRNNRDLCCLYICIISSTS